MSGLADRIAAVVKEHSYTYPDSFCACNTWVGTRPERDWPAHVAAELLALVRAERAAALREAAEGAYARFMDGKTLGAPTDVWLRERADRIEAGE